MSPRRSRARNTSKPAVATAARSPASVGPSSAAGFAIGPPRHDQRYALFLSLLRRRPARREEQDEQQRPNSQPRAEQRSRDEHWGHTRSVKNPHAKPIIELNISSLKTKASALSQRPYGDTDFLIQPLDGTAAKGGTDEPNLVSVQF